ncbi:unnamed protein product [Caenorhabditis sp. 36 PRJEB53466]|nr:unnamed protein product [Caenorhabditis sp. 36 PRJEB53466]
MDWRQSALGLSVLIVLTIASSESDMTLEDKRVENAMYAMVGEKPPHDVPLNHREETLHDMLVSSVKAVKESHVGHEHTNDSTHEHHGASAHHHAHKDHSGHEGGSAHDHVMMMWFHGGYHEVILFDFWRIHCLTGLIISCVVIFIMGALYEGLKWFRVYLTLAKRTKIPENEPIPLTEFGVKAKKDEAAVEEPLVHATSRSTTPESRHPGPFSFSRISQALLYIVQLVLAYWLMLIVMTYNIWLTLAVILGAGFGHWIFAALRLANPSGEAADTIATDACH